jgi:hypothetical protein
LNLPKIKAKIIAIILLQIRAIATIPSSPFLNAAKNKTSFRLILWPWIDEKIKGLKFRKVK